MQASSAAAASPRALGARTMAEAFRLTAEDHVDVVAVRTRNDEVRLTWGELCERVDAFAGGLATLGVRRGDPVALMLSNRPEFHIADLAAMTLGATPFSIYATLSPEQIAFVVRDAGAGVAIVEQAYAERFEAAGAQLPAIETVVLLDGAGWPGTVAWEEVDGADAHFDAEPVWRAVQPDDALTLTYTSGTTGPPKGVQVLHRNVLASVRSAARLAHFPAGAKVISWLPTANIAERNAHYYLPIVFGMTITTCPDPREIAGYLPAVRPTWFFAVPRVCEKLMSGLQAFVTSGEHSERNRAWLRAASEKVELEQAGREVPARLAATVAEADAALFASLRGMLGLDELIAVYVGGAPVPREVLVFFHAIGVPVGELWGSSETCGVGCCNPPDRIKIGTVGPPAPGVEVKLGEDGELLVRSEIVMAGYHNRPELTAEAIDADGWLHTGDIAEIDEDGYVRIVDRKQEIMINAAGKSMAPASIEATLKGASPLIGQTCVIGVGQRYNTALIVLDADFAPAWAQQRGLGARSLEELPDEPAMVAAVQAGVDIANDRLGRGEQIKRFTIVRGDWLPGGDELTPTMTLKRRPIEAKYAREIDAMYA